MSVSGTKRDRAARNRVKQIDPDRFARDEHQGGLKHHPSGACSRSPESGRATVLAGTARPRPKATMAFTPTAFPRASVKGPRNFPAPTGRPLEFNLVSPSPGARPMAWTIPVVTAPTQPKG